MSTNDNSMKVQVGPGFLGTLTIIFIVLKLLHVINWSWWGVLAPIWVPLAFAAVIIFIVGVVYVIKELAS